MTGRSRSWRACAQGNQKVLGASGTEVIKLQACATSSDEGRGWRRTLRRFSQRKLLSDTKPSSDQAVEPPEKNRAANRAKDRVSSGAPEAHPALVPPIVARSSNAAPAKVPAAAAKASVGNPASASQSANFNAGATVSRGAGAYIDIGRSIEYRSAANKEISRYIQQKLSEAVNAGALTPEQAQRAHDKIMARNPNGFQSSPPILQKKLETEIHQEVSDAAIANATKAGPPDAGRKVLSELLGTACQSQNEANVTLGRKAISRISHDWLLKTAPEVIESTLDVSDYWEYRRLLELLSLSAPELLPVYIQRGLASGDTDVREAAEDFS